MNSAAPPPRVSPARCTSDGALLGNNEGRCLENDPQRRQQRRELEKELTFVCVANEVFDQAAYFSHLFVPCGQSGGCDVRFARLHALCLLLDIALEESDSKSKRRLLAETGV